MTTVVLSSLTHYVVLCPCVGFFCCSTTVIISNILHLIIKKHWQSSACGVTFTFDDRTITCLGNQYLSNDKVCQIDRTHLKLLL